MTAKIKYFTLILTKIWRCMKKNKMSAKQIFCKIKSTSSKMGKVSDIEGSSNVMQSVCVLMLDHGQNNFERYGVCSMISYGLAITAKHVVYKHCFENKQPVRVLRKNSKGEDENWVATKIDISNDSDIAILHLRPTEKTRIIEPIQCITLDFAYVGENENIFMFSFDGSVNNDDQSVSLSTSSIHSAISEVFPFRRDKSNLSFPCFAFNETTNPGDSGAPIFNSNGNMIGLLSYSLELDPTVQEITNYSYGLYLWGGMGIELEINREKFSLGELHDKNEICIENYDYLVQHQDEHNQKYYTNKIIKDYMQLHDKLFHRTSFKIKKLGFNGFVHSIINDTELYAIEDGFITMDNKELYLNILDTVFNKVRQDLDNPRIKSIKAGEISSLLLIEDKGETFSVNINNLNVFIEAKLKRRFLIGEQIRNNDIVGYLKLFTEPEIPINKKFILIFSVGWEKGIVLNLNEVSNDKEYLSYCLASYYNLLAFRNRMSIDNETWEFYSNNYFFPFISLDDRLIKISKPESFGVSNTTFLQRVFTYFQENNFESQLNLIIEDFASSDILRPHIKKLTEALQHFSKNEYQKVLDINRGIISKTFYGDKSQNKQMHLNLLFHDKFKKFLEEKLLPDISDSSDTMFVEYLSIISFHSLYQIHYILGGGDGVIFKLTL